MTGKLRNAEIRGKRAAARWRLRKVHMIGIGGIGMSGIARILNKMGARVSGSDLETSAITGELASLGVKIYRGHSRRHVGRPDLVIVSSAIRPDNCELAQAQRIGVQVKKRAQVLSEIASENKTITVSGSHGKTTTASMLSSVFSAGRREHTAVVGGILKNISSNVRMGGREYFICEADESDSSFLCFSPIIACVTSIDTDHLDHYGGISGVKKAFVRHINKTPFYGKAVLCLDDTNVKSVLGGVEVPYYTYGLSPGADWTAAGIRMNSRKASFNVFFKGKKEGLVKMGMGGRHNILNALCACAAARYAGLDFEDVRKGLAEFQGVKRRLDEFGFFRGVRFIDDYAHHPSEISSVISAVKEIHGPGRTVVLFQPHRYTRTKILWREIAAALAAADVIYLMDVYPAGEKKPNGVSSGLILGALPKNKSFAFSSSLLVAKNLREGDVFISMGAGDVWKTGEEVRNRFELLSM